MSQPERKVLAQDQPQYQQSQRLTERKRQAEADKQYQLDLAKYESDVAAQKKAEAEYQAALAKADNAERKALEKQYKDKIDEIDRVTKQEAANIPQYETVYDRNTRSFVEKPIPQAVQKSMRDAILRKADEQKKNIQYTATSILNQFDFSQKYPGVTLGGSVRDQFKGSLGQESLISIYEKHVTDKSTEAEYRRRTSIQQAINAPRYTDLQRSAIESEHVGLLFTPSSQTQAAISRAEKINPTLPPANTIFPFTPTMAEKTRRPLINVETGNYISGEWKPNNAVALVAGLTKPQIKEGVQIVKTPEQEVVQETGFLYKGNVINEESGKALLKFQSRLEPNQEVPKSLYFGILQERGLPVTPFSKDIINTFASDRVKPTIKEAKGKKDTVTDPITDKSFNRETLSGDIGLGGILGYTFKTVEQPTIQLGKDVQGPPQPLWTIPDAFGNPRTDYSGNPILLKSQEKAENLSERFAKKPSKMTIPVLGGQRELIVQQPESPKKTSFNQLIENSYKSVDEFQTNLNKKYLGDTTISIVSMFSEGAKIALKTGSFIISGTEQYIDPYVEKALALKPTKRPAPILLPGTTSDETLFPIDFEKWEFKSPNRILTEAQQYREQQGGGAMVIGISSYYPGVGAVKPILGTVKEIPRIFTKFLKIEKKIVEKEGIAISTGGKELGTFPSKSWDLAEPVGRVGFRKESTKPVIPTEKIGFRPETSTAKPNPFGKERIIPYYFKQGLTGITTPIISTGRTIKESLFAAGSKVKRSVINIDKSPNLSIIEGRNVSIPNISRPQPVFSNLDVLKQNLEISYQKNVKPFLGKMGEVWQGRSEIPSTSKGFSSFDRFQQKIGIGLYKTRQSVGRIKGIELPKLSTPEFVKSAQRGWQGYKFMQQKRFETWKGGLPSLPTLRAPKITGKIKLSEQMELFKQKRDAKKIQSIFDEWNKTTPEPKVTVPSYGSNFLNKLKTLSGEKEPWDFLSKVKPFQKLNLRKEFASNMRGGPIGKIKGSTSRKEFARMLTESKQRGGIYNPPDISTKAGFGIKQPSVKELIAQGVSKGKRIERLKNIDELRFIPSIKTKAGFGIKNPTVKDLIKEGEFKQKRFEQLQRSERFSAPFTKAGFGIKQPSVKEMISEGIYKQKRFEQLQRSERFSAPFTKAGFGIKQPSVKELIAQGVSKGKRIERLKNIGDLKPLSQTIKPIFKVPPKLLKETEVEKMVREAKTAKPKNLPWKKVRIDKYVPKYPKSWESWKAVGLATGGTGALVTASTYQPQEASALPFSSRMIESGGQILIERIRPNKIPTDIPVGFGTPKFSTGTTKPVSGKPQMLVPPFKTLSEQREETKTKATTGIKLIPLEGVAIKSVQQSKIKTVQTPKIKTAQMPKFSLKLSTPQRTKTDQTPKLRERQRYREDTYQALRVKVTPKLAQKSAQKFATPTPLKQPVKLTPQITPKLKQPQRQVFKYARPPNTRPPRTKLGGLLPPKDSKIPESVKKKNREKQNFLGSSSEIQISGLFKRKEITYGDEKINKLLKGDIRVVQGKKRNPTKPSKAKYDILGFPTKKGRIKKDTRFW